MLIKTKKNWKDFAEFSSHHSISRRELLTRGLATGTLSVLMSNFVAGGFIKQAMAAAAGTCPGPVRNPGAIGQIFAEGGPTMGARFISDAQAASMNSNMAANYGISGQANLRKLGPNMNIDSTSPFGATLLQGPPGFPGGMAAWQSSVLNKISGGGHLGPFNADDGAGSDTGLLGGVSPFKTSQIGKDLRINVSNALASWANGLPATSISGNNLSPASLSNVFSLTPAASGLINSQALTFASDTTNALAAALGPIFNNSARKGAQQLQTNANCAFYGNSALADPAYGASLFNPANIVALSSKMTVANLSKAEQAQLSSFYQSANGVAGGVILQFDGRDYHGGDPQNDIAPADVEEARAIVMFLAACDAAQAPGSLMYFANGQAIANGTQAVNITINGNNVGMNAPVAADDAGGSYNAGLIIFYDPKGSPPMAKFTGTVDSTNGDAKIDSKVGSSKEAVAGLYLSALQWINNGNLPASALSALQATGVASNPSNIIVI